MKAWYQINEEILDFNPEHGWKKGETLWEALNMEERLKKAGNAPVTLSFVGGGGKTSYIRRLAWEGRERGKKVFVYTTTHMAMPEHFFLGEPSARLGKERLLRDSIAVAGKPVKEGKKIAFWEKEVSFYKEISMSADLVLVEADGSKRLPVKVPAETEPVIPQTSDVILSVFGLSALGKPGKEACFRLEYADRMLHCHGRKSYEGTENWNIVPEDLETLMKEGYLRPLREQFPGAEVIPVFHQADTEKQAEMGRKMLLQMQERAGIVSGDFCEEVSFSFF